ncbi:MAG: CotH kinase family protein [Planctomycetes bacterium]|nr:CotH kinase family protein [Planctomycetota bacterium]
MSFVRVAAVLSVLTACGPAPGAVVLNEILYHAPDDLDGLQFIELYNTDDAVVDLAGWKLTRGVRYTFPRETKIAANGYLVICKDPALFKKHYGFDAAGPFEGSLGHGRDRLDLLDARGRKVDSVRYGSRAPWPLAADGYSSSLERICPTAPADGPENWAPSPLRDGTRKAAGTPGKQNANYAPCLPPIVSKVVLTPTRAAPKEEIKVEAEVRSREGLRQVELCYRVAGSGFEKEEATIKMKAEGEKYTASVPGQKANQIVRLRIHAVDTKGTERWFPSEHDLRPALSVFVHEPFRPGKVPLGLVINIGEAEFRAGQREGGRFTFAPPGAKLPARGRCAFVWVDAKTGNPELFDFIQVTPRNAGRKVRFHKDHPLSGMTTINLIYEYMDRFALAETLAYEVYRKAGNAACRTDFVRTWVDGRPLGFQLLIEQPNRSFLRHAGLHSDGHLYKCQWFGAGLVGQHEKKTRPHDGHDDLVKLVDQLKRTKGDEQWAVIKKNFDVEQVANYFAVNMLLSHWDGYFNNYFAYHDIRTGKWTMYPWDQDKTWGFHDGIRGYEVFFDMPVTFGMAGDVPPGWPKDQPPPQGFFGVGSIWWRPGGHFSKPLLANPTFRKLFLARTKELVEKVYTQDVFFPLIKAMGERVEDEVRLRAELRREDPKQALEHLRRNLDSLREHLTKRRKFLLEQDEIKNAGKFDRSVLK